MLFVVEKITEIKEVTEIQKFCTKFEFSPYCLFHCVAINSGYCFK